MKKLSFIILFIGGFVLCTHDSIAQSAEELIEKGDSLWRGFDNEKALEVFLNADKLNPTNWEILWRISRCYVDIGEHMPNSTDEQKEAQLDIYQKALLFADSAVTLAPDESTPYLRRAVANGRIALFKGVFSVGGVVSKVRDDCHKAIALGKGGNEIQAIIHYVLARTHGKVSEKWSVLRAPLGLGWAVLDSAYIYYDKALKLDSSFLMIYTDYAKRLVSEDEYEKAREVIEASKNAAMKDEDDEKRLEELKELKNKVDEELD